MKSVNILLLLWFAWSLSAQEIIIDGDFRDWDAVDVAFTDDANDGQNNGIDLQKIWIADDEDYLFIRFQTGKVINLQEDNDLKLVIDVDADLNTGRKLNGVGADIIYYFGERYGTWYYGNNSSNFGANDIHLISAPNVTSDQFEILVKKDIGVIPKDIGNNIKIRLEDDAANGDDAPDALTGIAYTTNDYDRSYDFDLSRTPETHRLVTYNVLFDRMFESSVFDSYNAALNAIDPDILVFQEIYDHSATSTKNLVSSFLENTFWYSSKAGQDNIVVSKYPIIKSQRIDGNGAFLLDINDQEMIVFSVHFPCCQNNVDRQIEVDRLMRFIGDIRSGDSGFVQNRDVPIIICGDTNFVGDRDQLNTIITGDIYYDDSHGPDVSPDIDGSSLTAADAMTTGLPAEITWQTNSSYSPSKLDYVFYTDSGIKLYKDFTLNTRYLPTDVLTEYQLSSTTTAVNSDHLPVVVDFAIEMTSSSADDVLSGIEVYPTPANDVLNISTEAMVNMSFEIYDLTGKVVKNGMIKDRLTGIDVSDLSGEYVLKLIGQKKQSMHKIQVLR